jgi:DNA polymerase-3 subunit alpha
MDSIGQHYIARKHGTEKVEYSHDIIKSITSDTYGLVVYQEQVMQMCVELAGMSWSDADKIRKIIGKKKDVKEFEQYQDMFVRGASKHITKEEAIKLWHDFEAHANYSFNKSHAVAYSMISYWTAYLKHYYALEFVYALLKNEKNVDKRTEYLIDARRLGVQILLPHVNTSNIDFKLDSDGIRFGLSNIKFLSDKTARRIIKARPYKSYAQLVETAGQKNSGISTRTLEALNAVGAASFDDNPKTGEEPNHYYEYLNIPKFDLREVPPQILKQLTPSDKFTEDGTYIMMGMPKNIKRGDGWSRVDIVDESGSIGIFHDQHTPIETGRMYILLVNNNRISRFIEVGEKLDMDDPFVKFLMADSLDVPGGKTYTVDFSSRKTKAGKMMGYIVLAKSDKELRGAMVFPGEYRRALAGIRAGELCEVTLARTKDGSLFVKGIA